ncbi:hypothetical protein T492DRAFT_943469 [Pavlovales sp. CCMP2436]|nr:hypothetical protein T492DRAFT_943469 [Pavlovales sp. CCMP2436]
MAEIQKWDAPGAGSSTHPPRAPYRISSVTLGKLTFDADFDSGNCARVVAVAGTSDEFNVWTSADCAGTSVITEAKTWFHLSVRGGEVGSSISLTVNNMNGQGKLYLHDFRPVYRNGTSGEWQRIRTPVAARGSKEGDDFRISFTHRFDCAQDLPTFFAFSYPWSFAEGQTLLDELEAQFGAACPDASALAAGEGSGGETPQSDTDTVPKSAGDIYFRREVLAHSLEGRPLELLTITSTVGLGGPREPPLGNGLLPGGKLRPHVIAGRPMFVISARVHPGEVPASHVLNGFLRFILRTDDPRARAMREAFVLKILPCLNPDGVFHGHYRLDTRGENLNRYYSSPDRQLHPTIYAARALLEQLHAREVLKFHVDLHGHATKRGCFLFGNNIPDLQQIAETDLYAKLVFSLCNSIGGGKYTDDAELAVNTPVNPPPSFTPPISLRMVETVLYAKTIISCRKENHDGLSTEGAGRVAIYRLTGVAHCYTLECNYNTGRSLNKLAEPEPGRALSPPPIPPHSVGSALDLSGLNPLSRLQPPKQPGTGRSTVGSSLRGGIEAHRGWCFSNN